MLNLSNLLRMFCSNGSREASRSSSAFSRSRCRFEGLLFVTPSFGCGFKLELEEDGRGLIHIINKNVILAEQLNW